MALVYLAVCWTLGLAAGRVLGWPAWAWAALAAPALAAALWTRRQGGALLPLACLLAALAGGGRYALARPAVGPGDLAYLHGRDVIIEGYVAAEPDARGTYTRLELAAARVFTDGEWAAVRGRAVLDVARYAPYEYGDRVRVQGRLEAPPEIDGFDYREYLAARGVDSVLRYPQVTPLEGHAGCALLRLIYRAKGALQRSIEAALPHPEAGLLAGILLGIDHTLPEDLLEDFRAVGLVHIIVISGYNIGLVSQAMLAGAGRWLHRWAALGASLGGITLFTLLVGPTPPVLRAAVMAGVAIAGELLGRRSQALVSLAFVSLLMTAWNPLLLAGVSYQLSFAATLALILIEPRLARGAQAWLAARAGAPRARRWARVLRDFVLATLAAQILTLPLIWHHFGQVSLLSLPANVLVLPAQPPAMALGALAAGLGLVWPAAGQAVGALAWPLLRYSIAVVQTLAAPSWAAATGAALPVLAMAGIYLAVAAWLVPPAARAGAVRRAREALGRLAVALRGRRRWPWGLGLLLAVAAWAALAGLPDGRTHVYFLDVGQGDAVLIRGPTGRTALVDGGADPVLLASRLGEVLPFWQRRIDVVAATHADSDHLAGLVPLVQRYRVGAVLEPPAMATEEAAASPLVASWHAALAEAGLTPQVASAGMEIRLDRDLTLAVLHPAAGAAGGETDDNRHSLVLRVQAGAQRILLAADIDAVAEVGLLQAGADVRAVLLKVAHHGAATGSSAEFLAAVAPAAAVISVGAENRFGHPAEETLARLAAAGAAVYRTDQVGTVEAVTDGERLWLRAGRQRDAESDQTR